MSLHAYVDESFEGAYLMAVVLIEDSNVATTRSRTRRLRAGGAARFHMSSEKDVRRDRALSMIRDLPADLLVVEVSDTVRRTARRSRAIEAVVGECLRRDVARIIFELDVSVVTLDRRTVAQALQRRGSGSRVTYEFLRAVDEPLLWIPDAVAWAWARGGRWRRRLPRRAQHIRA